MKKQEPGTLISALACPQWILAETNKLQFGNWLLKQRDGNLPTLAIMLFSNEGINGVRCPAIYGVPRVRSGMGGLWPNDIVLIMSPSIFCDTPDTSNKHFPYGMVAHGRECGW